MIERFKGEKNRRVLLTAIMSQKMVNGDRELAQALADSAELITVAPNTHLIEQNGEGNEVYFILAGAFNVIVNGRVVGRREKNDHVGEMAAVEPSQRRAATIMAIEESVVVKITEEQFAKLGNVHPIIYLSIARELSRRLHQRNAFVSIRRKRIRVFVISSREACPIARAVNNAFKHDDNILVDLWTEGTFRATHYTLEDLERKVEDSDFAVAIAQGDDVTESRDKHWPVPRDNVIFELGLFMGRLGRRRAILMEPREDKVKLPSDLAGISTITYRFEKGADAAALMAPACNQLRDLITELGPH
jgi:predicted nucleotide-binding protein